MEIFKSHKVSATDSGGWLSISAKKGHVVAVPIKQLHAWIARKHRSAPADITHSIAEDGSILVTSPGSFTTIAPADLERWLLRTFRRESQ